MQPSRDSQPGFEMPPSLDAAANARRAQVRTIIVAVVVVDALALGAWLMLR